MKNKFFTHEFVPAASNSQVTERYGFFMENEEEVKEVKEIRKRKKKPGSGVDLLLHLLQHIAAVTAAVLLVAVFFGSFVVIESGSGNQIYNLRDEETGTDFEDSLLFNKLLGNHIADVVRFEAIRGQMETDGVFDAKKVVDATAFANRYNTVQPEYITASYYLDDLINWSKNGFEYDNVYMTGDEADQFLSRFHVVTMIDLDSGVYGGGNINYLNSDLKSATRVVDVSGNQFESGEYQREGTDATVLTNRYHTVDGKRIENHVATWEEYYALCQNIKKAADDLAVNYNEYLKYQDIYQEEESNVVYFIRKNTGKEVQVYTNMDTRTKDLKLLKEQLLDKCQRTVFYDPADMAYETDTLIEESTLRYILGGFGYAYPDNTQVMIGVRKDLASAQDGFYKAAADFKKYTPYSGQYLAIAIACVVFYLLLLVVLTMREGYAGRKEGGGIMIRLRKEDRIPTEIMAVAVCIAGMVMYRFIGWVVDALWQSIPEYVMILIAGLSALAVSLIFSFFYYSFVRRIKAGRLWKDSVVRRSGQAAARGARYAYRHWDIVLRVWVPFGIFVLLHICVMFVALFGRVRGSSGMNRLALVLIFLIFAADLVVGVILYRSAQARQVILEGIRKISGGDLEHKVKEEGMYGDDLVMARAVNSIGDSVKNAVETSMKDERLKADLITNVSHDIKTPLTSIINYVDLIKRENVKDPKIREYINVLDAKSQRLKQLTDDLVEASKISSGNIVLQWEKINLVELLKQTIGEFSEKFQEKALYPVINAPKEDIFIQADSRRIWRVIENLFNNIFKYALEGTRVYIDLEYAKNQEDGKKWVILSIKNISATPLKVSPEELTERFIRGDESRTTEGSGLGLSIAKNLVEVQNGIFEIVMDGDLFKVNLSFPLLEKGV